MTYHYAIPIGGLNPTIAKTRALLTGKAGVDVFIGLWLHPMDAKYLAQHAFITANAEGSEKAEDLHVTLAYIPQISLSGANKVKRLVREFSYSHGPVDARISGASRFTEGAGDKDAIVLRLESQPLMGFRAALVKHLEAGGVNMPQRFPVYKPHITLRYVPKEAIVPINWDSDESVELNLRRLVLRVGNERQEMSLDLASEGTGPQKAQIIKAGASQQADQPLASKAGARHTRSERQAIQEVHNAAVSLGAMCSGRAQKAGAPGQPLASKAGAKHNQSDRALIQMMHDNACELGAVCG